MYNTIPGGFVEGATCLSVFVGECLTRTGGQAIKKYSYYTGWRRDRDITKAKKNAPGID